MWTTVDRPGYFGRKRDEKVAAFDTLYGKGYWRLAWVMSDQALTFFSACRNFYEESYYKHLLYRPTDVSLICSYGECYDNAETNIQSGLDYSKQEAYSTHIQDIAVRNVLRRLDRWFEGPADKLLQIRSKDSDGFRFGPGNVPFMWTGYIAQPSLCPKWAMPGSVEDFWQSNKMLQVWKP